MAFESFDTEKMQAPRGKRMAVSVVSAIVLLAAFGVASIGFAGSAKAKEETIPEEELVDVKLAEEPEPEPEPEPEINNEPPPVAVPDNVKINPNAKPPPPLVTPKEIPKEKLKEADPSTDKGVAGSHEGGSPGGREGGRGKGGPKKPKPQKKVEKPKPKPKPVKKKKKITAIAEGTTPPQPISMPMAPYPAALRDEGVETRLVCRIKISSSGKVTGGKCFRGDRRFYGTAYRTLKRWKFHPAKDPDGNPVAFYKTITLPFKLN